MRTIWIAVTAAFSLGVLAIGTVSHAQLPEPYQSETAQEIKNVAIFRDAFRAIHQEFRGDAVPKYIAESYIEHNNGGFTGREQLARVFGHPPPAAAQMKIVAQTVYARGPFVLVHQRRQMTTPVGGTARMEIIELVKVTDGLLQEHWMFFPVDNPPSMQPQTAQEAKNVALVKAAWSQIWEHHDINAVPNYISDDYVDYSPDSQHGRAGMVQRLQHPAAGNGPVRIDSQTVYARGPLVVLQQNRQMPNPSHPGAAIRHEDVMEMFLVYDGLIQKHWACPAVEHGISAAWGE